VTGFYLLDRPASTEPDYLGDDQHGPMFLAPGADQPPALAVAGDWYPGAVVDRAPIDGGSMLADYPPRGVLHTTQGSSYAGARAVYIDANVWPHATCSFEGGRFRIWQHLPLHRAGRALRNPAGGVETNRAGAVQLEIVGFAERAGELAGEYLRGIAAWMRWVEAHAGVPRRSGLPWKPYPPSYGLDNGVRLAGGAWRLYSGWCGHQHVPEQDHGDPGLLEIGRLLGEEDDDMTPDQEAKLDRLLKVLAIEGASGPEQSIELLYQRAKGADVGIAALRREGMALRLDQAQLETLATLVATRLMLAGFPRLRGVITLSPVEPPLPPAAAVEASGPPA